MAATAPTSASFPHPRRMVARASQNPRRVSENGACAVALLGLVAWLVLGSGYERSAIVTFSSCAVVGLTLKWALGSSLMFTRLTLPGVFYAAYFALMSLASLCVYAEMDAHVKDTYLLAIDSVLATFPLGVLAAGLLFANPRAQVDRYARSPIQVTPQDVKFSRFVFRVYWASVGVTAVYVGVSEFVPIFKLVVDYSSQTDDVSLRFAVSELPRALLFALALARSLALPFCTLYLYYMSRVNGMGWKRDFLFVFVTSAGIACLSLERAPLMALCGMLVFGVAIASMHRPLRLRVVVTLVVVAALALGLAGFISALQYDSEVSVKEVQEGVRHVVVNRVLLASARAAALAFEEFPSPEHQLRGRYVRMFNVISGGEYLESRYAPRLVILPVSFVGDLWRNWGWSAVLLGGFVVGFLAQCVQLSLLVHKTVMAAVFHAILCLLFIWLIPGNAFGIVTTSLLLAAWGGGRLATRRNVPGGRSIAPRTVERPLNQREVQSARFVRGGRS